MEEMDSLSATRTPPSLLEQYSVNHTEINSLSMIVVKSCFCKKVDKYNKYIGFLP